MEQTMDMLENAQENQLTVHEPGQKEEKPPDNEQIFPDWYDGKKIDEIIFGDHLAELHPMRWVQGILYDTG